MTPDELRRLAEEATQRPQDDMEMLRYYTAQKSLIALAPDLARLCAEMGEALVEVDAIRIARASLAKLYALEAR